MTKKINIPNIGIAEVSEYIPSEDIEKQILNFEEKPANPKSEYGVYAEYIYPQNVVPIIKEYLEDGNSSDAPGNLVAYLYKKMPVYSYIFEGACYDIGTHEALKEVNDIYNK